MVVADLGRRLWESRAGGHWAGWALLFSALPLSASNILTTDETVALLETVAVWCAFRTATAASPGSGRAWAQGFHAALALAFLSKGPPALLAAAALLPFALRHRRRYAFGLAGMLNDNTYQKIDVPSFHFSTFFHHLFIGARFYQFQLQVDSIAGYSWRRLAYQVK